MNIQVYQILYFPFAVTLIFMVIHLLVRMGSKRGDQPKNKTCALWSIFLSVLLAIAIVSFGYIDQWQYVKSESELLRRVVITDDLDPGKLEIEGLNNAQIKHLKDGYVVIVTTKKSSSFLPLRIMKRHSTLMKLSNGKFYLITNKSNFPPYSLHPFFVTPKLNDYSMALEEVHSSIFMEWPFHSFFKITRILRPEKNTAAAWWKGLT